MWLTTPDEMKHVLWESPLEADLDASSSQIRGRPGLEGNVREAIRSMPVVSIGEPETWPLLDLYPRKKITNSMRTQLSKHDYYLVRFACSFLQVGKESRIEWARFRATLQSEALNQSLLAEDLYPNQIIQEFKHQVKVTLGPTLKFHEVEAGGVSAEFGLEYRELHPIISAAGVRQSDPSWDYRQAKGTEILGMKWMHALIQAPKGLATARALLDLEADVNVLGVSLPAFLTRKKPEETHLMVTLW